METVLECTGACAEEIRFNIERPCCLVAIMQRHKDPSGLIEVAKRVAPEACETAVDAVKTGLKVAPKIVASWDRLTLEARKSKEREVDRVPSRARRKRWP